MIGVLVDTVYGSMHLFHHCKAMPELLYAYSKLLLQIFRHYHLAAYNLL